MKITKSQLREIIKEELKSILSESKKPIPSFKTGYDIIDYFYTIKEFRKYYNKNASYDDVYFEIPSDVFKKVLGWTVKDVKRIKSKLEPYEGNIHWDREEDDIAVLGGA